MHRFYIPPARWNRDALVLDEAEAHHAADVLRLGPGEKVVVFNGEGSEVTAEIVEINRRGASLRALHAGQSQPLQCRITLAQAVPKGKTMDLIVQKATELGVAAIIPLLSERTVVQYDAKEAARKQEKWQHVAIEAAKQSGQNWLPHVAPPIRPKEFFDARHPYDLMLIASLQPDAQHPRQVISEIVAERGGQSPANVLVLVGPEGDFTPAEISLAKVSGCRPITLGPIVLRSETAAIYTVSILGYELLAP